MAEIYFTAEQRKSLEMELRKVEEAHASGKPGAIFGQVFQDRIRFGFVDHAKAVELVAIISGKESMAELRFELAQLAADKSRLEAKVIEVLEREAAPENTDDWDDIL